MEKKRLKTLIVIDKYLLQKQEYRDFIDQLRARPDLEIVKQIKKTEVIMPIGGDGTMLRAIKNFYGYSGKLFFGLNRGGHKGFLMTTPTPEKIDEIISGKTDIVLNKLLQADLFNINGVYIGTRLALNDFYFKHPDGRTAKILISVDGQKFEEPFTCDATIASSAAGSTAYNRSAGGLAIPVGTNLLTITTVAPSINWRTAQVSDKSIITLEALETHKYKANFFADGIKIPKVKKAIIRYSDICVKIGFAKSENYQSKVQESQFRGYLTKKEGG